MNIINRPVILFLTIVLVTVFGGCATATNSKPGVTTTIILTRHGDRDALSEGLNEKGRQRAKDLAQAAANMNITAIYCPDISRNRDTAKPLAKKLGIKPIIVSSSPNVNKITNILLTGHPGGTVLWVGNSNNLEGIYSLLGGEGSPPTAYGDLYIMKIKDGGDPEVIKQHYGSR